MGLTLGKCFTSLSPSDIICQEASPSLGLASSFSHWSRC